MLSTQRTAAFTLGSRSRSAGPRTRSKHGPSLPITTPRNNPCGDHDSRRSRRRGAFGPRGHSQGSISQGGVLTITGTTAGDRLELRQQPGGKLEVDEGINGSIDLRFNASSFTKVVVNGGLGDDVLQVDPDQVGGLSAPLTLNGQAGSDS